MSDVDFDIFTNYSIMQKQEIDIDNIAMSIVTPVYKNDPSLLLQSLLNEANKTSNNLRTEIIIIDDGSDSSELVKLINKFVLEFNIPVKFISLIKNMGRSFARNKLMEEAKGNYILFLDSDMLPDNDNFIKKWVDLIDEKSPEIAFGGFTILQASDDKKYDLAKELASKSDCINAKERTKRGALAVATSNLLVRKDIMQTIPFDCGFSGWGWEDVDWALRANSSGFNVIHYENSATHMGLDEANDLLKKLKNAGPNFKLILERHPEMEKLDTTKASRKLAKIPFATAAAPIISLAVQQEFLPVKLRAFALRVWRALWAAKALNN